MVPRHSAFLILLVCAAFGWMAQASDCHPAIPGDFETDRFLIPVYLLGPIDGALGSRWVTEVVLSNGSSSPVFVDNVGGVTSVGAFNLPIQPGVTMPLSFASITFSDSPGRFLDVEKDASGFSIQLRVRDVSREAIGFGDEVPIVRKSAVSAGPVNLAGIPVLEEYRLLLRVYDLERRPEAAVRILVFDVAPENEPDSLPDNLLGELVVPLTVGECDQPGYAEIPNLAGLASGSVHKSVRVLIEPIDEASKVWAFLTMTNNQTQQVTVVSPNQ